MGPRPLVFALLLLAAACGRDVLMRAPSDVAVSQASLDFGSVYLQGRARRPVTVVNRGAATETVRVASSGAPFGLSATGYPIAGGSTIEVPIDFAPSEVGASRGTATLTWGTGAAIVALSGEGAPWPACDGGSCQRAQFDPQLGACQFDPVPDGSRCLSSDPCLVDTLCASGQCLGQLRDCDDGDACTQDLCVSGQGCQHLSRDAACKADDPCQVGWCDSARGCQSAPVPDGSPCGTEDGCKSAGMCVAGRCEQTPAPDGTPCQLDWAPCAPDASCQAGSCESPTADAWVPGQVLWTFDAGVGTSGFNLVEVDAVDEAGDSYAIEANDEVLFSLDACGRTRWSQVLPNYPYDAMLWGTELVVQRGGLLAGHDAATGASKWTVDLAQLFGFCDGGPCGDTLEGALLVTPPVLNNLGQVLLTAQPNGHDDQTVLTAIGTDGTVQFVKTLSSPSARMGGVSQVADVVGNLYGYTANYFTNQPPALWSFDPQGNLRFEAPSYAQTHLSVGHGYVVDLGGKPAAAWSETGQQLFALPQPAASAPSLNSTAVIDAQGHLTLWPGAYWTQTPGLLRIDAQGNALASVLIEGTPLTELALDESGDTYLVAAAGSPTQFMLFRWDGQSSQPDLAVPLGPSEDSTGYRSIGQNLFISHGMALVTTGNTLQAIFIGKHGAPLDAPWPRGYGGTNENRRSPPLPLPPSGG